MTLNIDLNLGPRKPTIRPAKEISYVPMGKGKTRRKKVASPLRMVIAANVTARAKHQFKGSKNLPKSIRDASADAESEKLTKSWIQLVMEGKVGISIDQLDQLAKAIDLMPYQLLLEGLEPKNPQVAHGAALGEEAVYKIREVVREELSRTDPGLKPSPLHKK